MLVLVIVVMIVLNLVDLCFFEVDIIYILVWI